MTDELMPLEVSETVAPPRNPRLDGGKKATSHPGSYIMNQVQEPETTQSGAHLLSTQEDDTSPETRGANLPCPTCDVDRKA